MTYVSRLREPVVDVGEKREEGKKGEAQAA